MSEYQYYEFLALDRSLTAEDKAYVESISSRVQITSNQAIFVYNYGDFRGNPQGVLTRCFDIMLYMANWGSRQLMFRFPKSLINVAALEAYSLEDAITVSNIDNFVVLDINVIDEDIIGWVDTGEGFLSGMISLRESILQGDYRCLYLAWLKAATIYIDPDEEDLLEPPIPNNLDSLSGSLGAFVDFFAIDEDLITAAATASDFAQEEGESLEDLILDLSVREKNDFLIRLLKGETHLNIRLTHRLRELSPKTEVDVKSNTLRRKLSQLLELAQEETTRREEKEREL